MRLDSFDICKFNAFAEGIEEYVLKYNGMTGLDVSEEVLLEDGIPGYGSKRENCELEEMKTEYYEHRGWVDRFVPDEKLNELGINAEPGTDVSADGGTAAPSGD